jgi:hypothetical protein
MPRYAHGPYAKNEHMRTHTHGDWELKLDGAMHLNGRAQDSGTEAELVTKVEPVIMLDDIMVNSSALAKTLNSVPEGPIGGPDPKVESECTPAAMPQAGHTLVPGASLKLPESLQSHPCATKDPSTNLKQRSIPANILDAEQAL